MTCRQGSVSVQANCMRQRDGCDKRAWDQDMDEHAGETWREQTGQHGQTALHGQTDGTGQGEQMRRHVDLAGARDVRAQ